MIIYLLNHNQDQDVTVGISTFMNLVLLLISVIILKALGFLLPVQHLGGGGGGVSTLFVKLDPDILSNFQG